MNLALVLLVPFFYGLANLGDKYVVSKKIVATETYLVLIGGVHLALGLLLAVFLDWSLPWRDLIVAVPCGVLYAAQLYFYYFLFSSEDASNIVALEFTYPVVVAALAYVFLGERIGTIGYVGMLLMVAGITVVGVRMSKVKLSAKPWMILALILANGFNEFFVKIAAGKLPGPLGLAIESMVAGVLVAGLLLRRRIRKAVARELPNLRYAVGIELLTLTSILFKFLSMARMPAVYVASITALQPLIVLSGERLFFTKGVLVKDPALGPKLAGIGIVVTGLALLMWSME